MKNEISVEVWDEAVGDYVDAKLPAKWAICGTCRGNGQHSLAIGAITQEDREDWSDDEFANYLNGVYDRSCDPCGGTGKVQIVDEEAVARDPRLQALAKSHHEAGEIDREIDAMHAAEIAMGC